MRWELKVALYIFGIFLIVFLSILSVGRLEPLPLPAPIPLGRTVIEVILFIDMLIIIWRLKSPYAVSNAGYQTMSEGWDIHHFPWHSDIIKNAEDKEMGDLTYMFPGGINYAGINLPSDSKGPIWIFPRRFEGRIGKDPICYAWIRKTPFRNLPPDVRMTLIREFTNRLGDPEKADICFGTTGMLDGSDTPENQKIEFEMQEKYAYAKDLEDLTEKLRVELRKEKEAKSKPVFVGKEIMPAGEQ